MWIDMRGSDDGGGEWDGDESVGGGGEADVSVWAGAEVGGCIRKYLGLHAEDFPVERMPPFLKKFGG